MRVTETAKNMRLGFSSVMHQIFQNLKTSHPTLGAKDAEDIEKLMLELIAARIDGPDGFVARSYTIYDKYFTLEEIDELTRFYATPIGKKLNRISPAMSSEEMQLGRQIAVEMFADVQTKMLGLLKERGLVVANTSVSIISNSKPQYPLQSKQSGEEGTVVLRLLVRRDGTLGDVVIKTSSGYGRLDQAAIEAVKLYKFLPATINGQAVDEWFKIPFVFKLDGGSK